MSNIILQIGVGMLVFQYAKYLCSWAYSLGNEGAGKKKSVRICLDRVHLKSLLI